MQRSACARWVGGVVNPNTAAKTVDVQRDTNVTLVRAFWEKIEVQPNGCWRWTAGIYPTNGYGYFRNRKAHRVAYELFVEPIPEGMTIDHVCHTLDIDCLGGRTCPHRLCVCPDHLAVKTREENYRLGRLGSGALKGRMPRRANR